MGILLLHFVIMVKINACFVDVLLGFTSICTTLVEEPQAIKGSLELIQQAK